MYNFLTLVLAILHLILFDNFLGFAKIEIVTPNLRSIQGQISIMVGVMMTTFILFFAFVINTGMLVNAKINLQNAADLAAYAGAAVQARQLTHISYLNYEMRRQYKKFLFRIYVIGNMAMDDFPRGSGQTGSMDYIPNINDPTKKYEIPSTCVIFNAQDNFCHLTQLSRISIPPETYLDSVTDTLRGQLQAIENIRQNNCKAIGLTNKLLNVYWLFNADPTLAKFDTLEADQRNAVSIIKGLAYGLGIVPREMILRNRIKTLNDYVNAEANLSVNLEKAEQLLNGVDPAKTERTAQAFYSAYYTLGNHTFPAASIFLDELLPKGSTGSSLLVLKNIQQKIDTFAVDFALGNNGLGANPGMNPEDCMVRIVPISISGPLTVGVYKDPTILTYYAIRLRAKARLLFSPFGDLDLKAYAAAQPFGSRIGPTEQIAQFGFQVNEANSFIVAPGMQPNIPNLAVKKENDSAGKGQGWDTKEVLGSMYESLANASGQTLSNTITSSDMERAYFPAMAPNPWEGSRYNVINDQVADSFVRNFTLEPGGISGETSIASFWAPVFAPDKIAAASQDLKTQIDALFAITGDASTGGNIGVGAGAVESLRTVLQQGLNDYVSTALQSGQGEYNEGINIVRITNPFLKSAGAQPQVISGNPQIFMTNNPSDYRSSWNSVNDGNYRTEGRVGYSVKFVSFDSLTAKKLSTNGRDTWNNNMALDAEAEMDVPFIKH